MIAQTLFAAIMGIDAFKVTLEADLFIMVKARIHKNNNRC